MIVNYAEDESVHVEDLGKDQTDEIDWDDLELEEEFESDSD